MKIWCTVWSKGGEPIIRSEVTRWDPIVAAGLQSRMHEIGQRNPGSYWNFGVEYEDSDGPAFVNVPPWKLKLAAAVIQSGQQDELRTQVEEGRARNKKFMH